MDQEKESLLKALDPTPSQVAFAKQGNHLAARALVEEAARKLLNREPLHPELADWLAHHLQDLLKAGQKKDTFNLSKPRGRQPKHNEDMRLMVAQSIHGSGLGLHKSSNSEGSVKGAYTEAAELPGSTVDPVTR